MPDFRNARFYAYHAATKHSQARLMSNTHRLDWSNQPDPVRRYDGAERMALPLEAELSRLLYYSLAISAWKQIPGTEHRWALRVNPSSGNLHPTEAHVITKDGTFHYYARDHVLERRSPTPVDVWSLVSTDPPPPVTLVLTS